MVTCVCDGVWLCVMACVCVCLYVYVCVCAGERERGVVFEREERISIFPSVALLSISCSPLRVGVRTHSRHSHARTHTHTHAHTRTHTHTHTTHARNRSPRTNQPTKCTFQPACSRTAAWYPSYCSTHREEPQTRTCTCTCCTCHAWARYEVCTMHAATTTRPLHPRRAISCRCLLAPGRKLTEERGQLVERRVVLE